VSIVAIARYVVGVQLDDMTKKGHDIAISLEYGTARNDAGAR
jgi:hypothetical protein